MFQCNFENKFLGRWVNEYMGKTFYGHTSFYYASCCCTVVFTDGRSVVILHWTSLLVSFSNSICSLSVSVSHFGNSWTFSLYLLMVIRDLWLLTLLLQLLWGTTNCTYIRQWTWLINIVCVLTAALTGCSPHLSPLASLFSDNDTEIRPVNNPMMACKCSGERRVTCLSL